ncbi:MAG: GNAT family N-acetyltransferase [Gammaproteobacteria bacterium]
MINEHEQTHSMSNAITNQLSLVITALDGPEDAKAFKTLNEEWITRLFTLEEEDRRILNDPQAEIVDRGGRVLLARIDGRIVGCVALVPGHPGMFELGKMSVEPELRNHGIGRKIVIAAISEARRIGAHSIFLGSSTRLPAAVHLYESLGFTHVTREELGPLPYARADTFMRLLLRQAG